LSISQIPDSEHQRRSAKPSRARFISLSVTENRSATRSSICSS